MLLQQLGGIEPMIPPSRDAVAAAAAAASLTRRNRTHDTAESRCYCSSAVAVSLGGIQPMIPPSCDAAAAAAVDAVAAKSAVSQEKFRLI